MKPTRAVPPTGRSRRRDHVALARMSKQAQRVLMQRKSTIRHENRLRRARMGEGKHRAATWE